MEEVPLPIRQAALDKRHYSSLAALILLIVNHAATCKHEYTLVWRSPWSTVKVLYLGSRYFAFAAEIVHYSLIHAFLLRGPVKLEICRAWYLFLLLSCTILSATLDCVLFLRVYALYQKNRRLYALCLLLSLPYVAAAVMIWRIFSYAGSFNDTCDLTTVPIESAVIGSTFVFGHLSLWIASYAKRDVAQGHSIVVKLVVQEGAWVFALLSAIVVCMTPYSFASQTANPFILFVWPIAGISIVSCRLIISMRKLKVAPSPAIDDGLDFPLSTFVRTLRDSESIEGLDDSRFVT